MPWGDHRGAKGASPRIARRLATAGPPASGVVEVLTPSLGGRVLLTELTKHGLAAKAQEGTRLRGLCGRRGCSVAAARVADVASGLPDRTNGKATCLLGHYHVRIPSDRHHNVSLLHREVWTREKEEARFSLPSHRNDEQIETIPQIQLNQRMSNAGFRQHHVPHHIFALQRNIVQEVGLEILRAIRWAVSRSGKMTSSAPTILRMVPCTSLRAFARMTGSPISFRCRVARMLVSMVPPVLTMASSKSLLTTERSASRSPASKQIARCTSCLLYTSDAADDLTRVDLGGRRIIKKKKKK